MAPRYQAHYKSSLERYAAKKLGKKPIRDITVEAVEAAVGYLLQAASRSE